MEPLRHFEGEVGAAKHTFDAAREVEVREEAERAVLAEAETEFVSEYRVHVAKAPVTVPDAERPWIRSVAST